MKTSFAVIALGLAMGTSAAYTQTPSFMTEQPATQWRVSKLMGLNVYGTDNAKIGDVNEILVDQKGMAQGVVIGVGGFLGIGEKNVAVPFDALKWQTQGRTVASGAASTGAPGANTNSGTSQMDAMNRTANQGYPDQAVLAATKADLQNAPTFRYMADATRASTNVNANTPANTMPTSGAMAPSSGAMAPSSGAMAPGGAMSPSNNSSGTMGAAPAKP